MQEEVENRTLTLGINTTKFTGRVLKAALTKYLAHRKEKKLQASRDSPEVKSFGKTTMEELQKEYGDMRQIDIQDKGLRDFDRIAREHGVRYTVFKTQKGHYQIFFKAPNEANMNAAFQKFTAVKVKKAERRESVLGKLEKFKALVKNAVTDRTRRKELER
ncbi:PcfB family protein [Enterocloster clostridioformis]|uniref:PcfB family protein n=1 Tax=Enterocloster clostridioformis TaxID=1531 RepID=UPI002675AB6B|nr:PcfB family protein [Enterocloster clostridioformis]